MKNTRIDTHKVTVNDTGKYALQLNYFFGLFDTKAEAEAAYHAIMSPWDSIDDSPYGMIGILPPNYRDIPLPEFGITEEQPLSGLQAIDIIDYALKNPKRRAARYGFDNSGTDKLAGKSRLPARLAIYKSRGIMHDGFFSALPEIAFKRYSEADEQADWLKVCPEARLEDYDFSQRDFLGEWSSERLPTLQLP